MSGALCSGRTETPATTSLVGLRSADQDAFTVAYGALRSVRRIAAHDADRQGFGNVFRDGQKLWHRIEGLSPKILVKPGNDNTFPEPGQLLGNLHDPAVKKLALVDADHLSLARLRKDF